MALFAQPISMTIVPPVRRPILWRQVATGSIAILVLALMVLAIGRNQSG